MNRIDCINTITLLFALFAQLNKAATGIAIAKRDQLFSITKHSDDGGFVVTFLLPIDVLYSEVTLADSSIIMSYSLDAHSQPKRNDHVRVQ